MVDSECVFCKIASHKMEAVVEYEDGEWIVFHDINPLAPVHLLLVPKEHFCWWDSLNGKREKLGELFGIAVRMATKMGIKNSGFKLVMNGGKGAGQTMDHFHVHLMGGWVSSEKSKVKSQKLMN